MRPKINVFILFSMINMVLTCCKSDNNSPLHQAGVIEHQIESKVVFNNPVYIGGSTFGNYFQTLYKLGQFEEMLKFTSEGSVKKWGKQNILKTFKEMEFGYEIKLKSKMDNKDGVIILNYEKNTMNTKGILRMNIVIEHDTAKVVLGNIKKMEIF